MTKYEYNKKLLNTNTNTIRIIKNNWIQIRILFRLSKVTKYKYYSAFENWPNTNAIQIFKNDRIRIWILFAFSKITEYEYKYYSDYQKLLNMNTIRIINNDWILIRILFRLWEITEYEYKYYSDYQKWLDALHGSSPTHKLWLQPKMAKAKADRKISPPPLKAPKFTFLTVFSSWVVPNGLK